MSFVATIYLVATKYIVATNIDVATIYIHAGLMFVATNSIM
jgi:hypothetical protein